MVIQTVELLQGFLFYIRLHAHQICSKSRRGCVAIVQQVDSYVIKTNRTWCVMLLCSLLCCVDV